MTKKKGIKTSIVLDEDLLNRVEEYRSKIRPIPSRTDAIKLLLNKVLREEKKTVVKEEKKVVVQ